ncbi:MAG: DUF4159 domain-containing protein, partial [Phycisphaerae bacterium]|nr:DUF4159 domain-containing protein [Phycisphaerae bacterium]
LINKISLGTLPLADYNDATNICREANRKLNRNLSWRKMTPYATLEKLRQAPVLYLAVGSNPTPPRDFSRRLGEYLDNGGVVIVQPLAGDGKLTKAARTYLNGLSEDSSAKPVTFANPNLHSFSVMAIGPAGRQKIFLLQSDVSKSWHKGYHKTRAAAFDVFFDIMARATSSRSFKRKFSLPKPVLALRAVKPERYIRIACLGAGDEKTSVPAAVRKLSNELAAGISVGIKQTRLKPDEQIGEDYPLAWLSNINAFSPADFRKIKGYLKRGGLLLIDGDGRDESFKKAEKLLGQMFSADAIRPIPADHPLLSGKFGGGIGNDIRQVQYNPAAEKRVGNTEAKPQLFIVKRGGRIVVILSRYGIAAPATGIPPAGYVGYKPKDAQRIALNILLYNCAAQQKAK